LAEAWGQFYRTYDPLLRRFAHACRVPPADLNDCLQEVWADLVRKLPAFRYDPGRGRFESWLWAFVHGEAADLLRRRARRLTECLDSQEGASLGGRDADPATDYERQCQQEAVRHVLDRLRNQVPACSYQAFSMRWVEGRTVAEIAAALHLTSEQVWWRLHRVKDRFHDLFLLLHPL
jgi:RNA polymerase sigma-70 factor (ECF subfamily)